MLDKDGEHINFDLRSLEVGDIYNSTTFCGHLEVALNIVASDHIENHVHTFSFCGSVNDRNIIFLMIVDRNVRTKTAAGVTFSFAASGNENLCPHCFAKLDGGRPDATASTMHQQLFSSFEAGTVKNIA